MDYTKDLDKRKREAILRAKQMHARAKKSSSPPVITLPEVMQDDPDKKLCKIDEKIPSSQSKQVEEEFSPLNSAKRVLKQMGLDMDTVIILILLYFLIDEAADKSLIFALIYLLMQ